MYNQLVFECEHCVDLILWFNMDLVLKQTKTFKASVLIIYMYLGMKVMIHRGGGGGVKWH